VIPLLALSFVGTQQLLVTARLLAINFIGREPQVNFLPW
jgi:hypothetical protein